MPWRIGTTPVRYVERVRIEADHVRSGIPRNHPNQARTAQHRITAWLWCWVPGGGPVLLVVRWRGFPGYPGRGGGGWLRLYKEPSGFRAVMVPSGSMVMVQPRLILSFRVSRGCDLRRPVVDSVADGTSAA